ncbi:MULTISPECIES: hypothetical protein [unclassified Microcoleus]
MKIVTKLYNWAMGRESRSRLQGVRSSFGSWIQAQHQAAVGKI